VHDPVADPDEAMHEYGVRLQPWEDLPLGAAMVAAVAHNEFKSRPVDDLLGKLQPNGVFIDVKSQYDQRALLARGIGVWRL
jgi:UDP-N-acetyl-D-galactosamine dehydrogenase